MTTSNTPEWRTVSTRLTLAECDQLDELRAQFRSASRSVVATAALRAGLEVLAEDPGRVLELCADFAHVRSGAVTPKGGTP